MSGRYDPPEMSINADVAALEARHAEGMKLKVRRERRPVVLPRALMVGVLAFGILGFASPFLPEISIAHGQSWLVDTWSMTGFLAACCAAAAWAASKSTYIATAALAGLGVGTCAAVFAAPDVQGPGFDLLAWMSGIIMICAAVLQLRHPNENTTYG